MPKTFGVTGGAGFIGTNLCERLLNDGCEVVILDNLSRRGAEQNLAWLSERFEDRLTFLRADIASNPDQLREFAERVDVIFHLAAQVAVTTSVRDPRHDYAVNVLGTFNLLEAVRESANRPGLVYASTNKVYGGLEDMGIGETDDSYALVDTPNGVPETRPLDFHSPYGCSKGAADQYVHDYGRTYGLSTVVLRQSCIYGQRQFGIEDQGWVAWFIIAAVTGRPITLYGTGKQVRDVLFIDDLTDLFLTIAEDIDRLGGAILNVGGGPDKKISLLQFLKMLGEVRGEEVPFDFGEARVGDQPVYVSDIRKAEALTGWTPKIDVEEGVQRLVTWVEDNRNLFED